MPQLQHMELRDYQLDVLRRVAEAFQAGYKRPCIASACGSGKTVMFAWMADSIQKKGHTVWFLVHRRELMEQTEETFERFGINRESVYIGMVGTAARRLDSLPEPHTIIFDECHLSAAATWRKIIDAYPRAFIIGLTATPCRLDGKPLSAVYDCLVEGPQTGELIRGGWLAPFKYYAPDVADLSALKRRGGDFDMERAGELLGGSVFGDVIGHYKRLASPRRTVCYCANIRHSRAMAEAFRAAGINAVHFDGDTPSGERSRIVADFRAGKIQVLCNVDLISTGFDCPGIEACILLRPTMSTALYIQQASRTLRPSEGKTAVILDHVGNALRHGLPDERRVWSLEGGIEKRPTYTEKGRLTVRICPNCFSAYDGRLDSCPYCGAQTELTQDEIKNIKGIELKELKARREAEADEAVKNMDSPDSCHNMAQLQAYARKKGYKSGWCWFMAKQRGWKLERK